MHMLKSSQGRALICLVEHDPGAPPASVNASRVPVATGRRQDAKCATALHP